MILCRIPVEGSLLSFTAAVPFVTGERRMAWFLCDCGTHKPMRVTSVLRGKILSCGCQREAKRLAAITTHGKTGTPEHMSWHAMHTRCRHPENPKNARYSGRGIAVDPRWNSFDVFLVDMGPRPPGASLERVDNDGPYCPENCKWASPAEQQRNTKQSVRLMYRGASYVLGDLARLAGLQYETLWYRIRRHGWDVERAVETPVRGSQ